MNFDMIGPGIVLGLSCIGSAIGCGIASMALHGVMIHTTEGLGRYIGVSVMPSSQAIYGIVLMIMMKNRILAQTVSPLSALGIAIAIGFAIMLSAIYQGKSAATAIEASAKNPVVFGKAAIGVGVIEGFAVFAWVFATLLM